MRVEVTRALVARVLTLLAIFCLILLSQQLLQVAIQLPLGYSEHLWFGMIWDRLIFCCGHTHNSMEPVVLHERRSLLHARVVLVVLDHRYLQNKKVYLALDSRFC